MNFPLALILSMAGLAWHANAHALACGDTVTEDTTLIDDLSCTSGGYALYVATPGVTIDFNGYSVTGTKTMDGIRVVNASDVTLLYGNLIGFRIGVNATRADRLTVSGMLMAELGSGVIASDSRAATLIGNTAYSLERWGFFLPAFRRSGRPLGGHTIVGNFLVGSPTLIGVCGHANSGNIIRDNQLYDGGVHLLDGAGRNEITNNVMEGSNSPDSGIVLLGSRHNVIRDNSIFQYGKGISLIPSYTGTCAAGPLPLPQVSHNQLIGNDITIGQTAIVLGGGDRRHPLVFNNRIRDNSIAAFDLGLHLRTDAFANVASGNLFFNTLREVRNEGFANRIAGPGFGFVSGPSRISVKPAAHPQPSAAEARAHAAGFRPQGTNQKPTVSPSLRPRSSRLTK